MDRAGVYPGAYGTDPSWRAEIVARALAVRAFYSRAAAAGHAVVSALT